MLNPDHRRYFIPEDGSVRLLEAQRYRTDYNKARKAIWEYVESIGGAAYTDALDGGLGNVRFEGKPPFGWKTKDKEGLSRPRLHSQASKDIAVLPRMPKTVDYLQGVNFITEIEYYSEPDAPLSRVPIGHIGSMTGIDWFDVKGPLLVIIPDQALTCAALKRKFPNISFVNDCHLNEPNTEGMREVLVKEWELMEEKHKRGMA